MIDWMILVMSRPLSTEEHIDDSTSPLLARWETGLGGTDWLESLVAQEKAQCFGLSGYPNTYSASAADVLPLIANGPPKHNGIEIIGDDYVMPANWAGEYRAFDDRIAACSPDQILHIEAWDQS